jgi:hypothetical protein
MISDAHSGIKAARKAVMPSVPWQRCHIYLLNKQGYNQTFIAKSMGRNKSTIPVGVCVFF